jgi:hypothetical protein
MRLIRKNDGRRQKDEITFSSYIHSNADTAPDEVELFAALRTCSTGNGKVISNSRAGLKRTNPYKELLYKGTEFKWCKEKERAGFHGISSYYFATKEDQAGDIISDQIRFKLFPFPSTNSLAI